MDALENGMDVNANIRPDAAAAAIRRSGGFDRSAPVGRAAQDQFSASGISSGISSSGSSGVSSGMYSGVVDTVEISDKAREALQQSRIALPYTEKDLAPLKARFAGFSGKENSIHARLASLLVKQGFRPDKLDQVKVEIDSNGRAIVGGIADVKAARALEQAINGDRRLLKDIAAYQKEEKSLSFALKETTGMSLNDYSSHIGTLQKLGEEIFLEEANVDSEFASMLGEQYSDDTVSVNITGQHNILENAAGVVNGMMREVTGRVEQAFREMNREIQESGGDPQAVEGSLVHLNRLKISVDNAGSLTIEGTASKNNPNTDKTAKKVIADMFEKELRTNPDFETAAGYLLNTYDETFGEGNPLGLGEDARVLEAVYDHGKIGSNVSSPEREAELNGEIDKSAKDALKDMGVAAGDLEDIVIEMNDEGKLVAVNLDPDASDAPNSLNSLGAETVQKALDFLNRQVENRSIEDARGEESVFDADPVKRLKGLMANMDVFRPGGAGLLKRAEAAA